MRILKVENHLSVSELREIMESQKLIRDFKDWQIIYSVSNNYGKKASEIAAILGVTESKIYKAVQRYNKLGINWKNGIQWGGRREERCIMAIEKEKEFLRSVEVDALNGQIVTYQLIKSKLEATIHRTVSEDYIWGMLKRHKWTKKVPRQYHPKVDKLAQEEYKKNSKRIWLPSH